FTKKWGRRFPWLLLGGFPLGFCYFLVFFPPSIDPVGGAWIIFAWLTFTTCLFDTFHSIYFVSFQSLFPDKFGSIEERRTAAAVYIPLGLIGTALGAILPPLIITFEDLQSYIIQGLIVMVITIATMLLAIPGHRDDQQTVDIYLTTYEKQVKRESFFKSMRLAFKQKSFIAFMIIYTMYYVIINSLQASLPFVVRFAVESKYQKARFTTFIMAGLLIGTIISIPLWVKLAKKTNDNGKVMLISAILLGVFAFPLLFIKAYWSLVIAMTVWGIALGGFWSMIFPVFSDVIDESIVRYKKREEGTYIGIQQFFGRLGLIIQVLSFAIVHELTGFVEGADTQTDLAIWGIYIHAALIPMIFILIGALFFWILYDLNPEKISENRRNIKELDL
ncbi:MAG: MFS transporter, partial [Promethearchaeota archaeon]